MRKPELTEKMIDYLEERMLCGIYPVNSRIPSVRRLASKFNLSYGTALRGIDYLCRIGRLEKIPKQGIYVCRPPAVETPRLNGQKRIIFFIGTEPEGNMQSMWYASLLGMSEAAIALGHTVALTPMPLDDSCNDVLEHESRHADGAVIFKVHPWNFQPVHINIPVAGILFEDTLEHTVTTFNLDPADAAATAVKFFRGKGISHVNVHSSAREIFMERGYWFQRLWREAGGSSSFDSERPWSYRPEEGYFFTSDHYCQLALEEYCGRTGKLPDISTLLSLDGKRLINPDYYPFPTVALDWKLLGRCVLEELLLRIGRPGTPVKNIALCGNLVL